MPDGRSWEDRRRENTTLNGVEQRNAATVLASRPRMVFVELTRSCSLACPMCRPGVTTKIITNLAPRSVEWWSELGRREVLVGISLEAASPELYEQTRRGAKHSRFLANLGAIRGAQLQRDGAADTYLNVTISDETVDEIPALVELAARFQIPLLTLNPIFREGSDGSLEVGMTPAVVPQLRERLTSAQAAADRHGVELRIGANLVKGCRLGGYDQCIHPWTYVYIRYDGGVGFCDHLTTHDAAIFGNIAGQDFMEVWNGASYQRLRQEHRNHDFARLDRLGLECSWCYRNRYTDGEYLIEPSMRITSLGRTVEVDQLIPLRPVRKA